MLDVAYPGSAIGKAGAGRVSSINGKDGDVILTADDIGALPKAVAIKADNQILPNEMVTYDPTTRTLLPAGIHDSNDELNFFDKSLLLGGFRASSQGTELIFQNDVSKDFSFPLVQPIGQVGNPSRPKIRAFMSSLHETGAANAGDIINPRWVRNKNYEAILVRIKFRAVNPVNNLLLRVSYGTPITQFRIKLGSVSAGDNNIAFQRPLPLPKNTNITLSFESADGPVSIRGDGTTPWYDAYGSKYEWTGIAMQIEANIATTAANEAKAKATANETKIQTIENEYARLDGPTFTGDTNVSGDFTANKVIATEESTANPPVAIGGGIQLSGDLQHGYITPLENGAEQTAAQLKYSLTTKKWTFGGVNIGGTPPTPGFNLDPTVDPTSDTVAAGLYLVALKGFINPPPGIHKFGHDGLLQKIDGWGASGAGKLIEYYENKAVWAKFKVDGSWSNWIKISRGIEITGGDLPTSGSNPEDRAVKVGRYSVDSAGFTGSPAGIPSGKFEGFLRKSAEWGGNKAGQLIEYYGNNTLWIKTSAGRNIWNNWIEIGTGANDSIIDGGNALTTLDTGTYQILGKFANGPSTLAAQSSSFWQGVAIITKGIGTAKNSGLIMYHNRLGAWWQMQYAGSWLPWQKLSGNMDASPPHHSPQHSPAVVPSWSSANAEVTGGWADSIGQPINTVKHIINGGHLTISKTGSNPQYAYLLMSPENALHVTGIKIDSGLASEWDHHSVVINNIQYTVFESPYKFTDATIRIDVEWDA